MSYLSNTTPNPLNISQDASNRTRVSQSTTLHDGKLLNADSSLMFDTKGTGRVLHSGLLSQGQPVPFGNLDKDFLSYLGCTIDNVMDQIVLVVTPLTANITLNGCLNWKEY